MQDDLPDLPPVIETKSKSLGFLARVKGAGQDDKRLVKLILLIGFGVLLILGVVASILEQVAPKNGQGPKSSLAPNLASWQIAVLPNQIILGFFQDVNKNNQFDYQEKPFAKVSVAIRRQGETEPFRRVSADSDGIVKIDDLGLGDYEVSYDNYAEPNEADWLFFEEYQQAGEFLPMAWRRITLAESGYKELVGINPYQPPLLLALETDQGLSWYDPQRARVYGRSNLAVADPAMIGRDIYYLQDDKLKKLDWTYRTVSEELIWLDEAKTGNWWLSPQGKTVAYLSGKEFRFRSQDETCTEGGLLWEGVRPAVKTVSFIDETKWLVVAQTNKDQPWELFLVDCHQAELAPTLAEPVNAGYLGGNDWFYSTSEATYLFDSANRQSVKYTALGGGGGITVSTDHRYLLKPLSSGNWLVVDYPAVKTAKVEKHYLLTGITGEPTLIGDYVYFVRGKPCQADGDCGEVVRLKLEASGIWSIDATWDLKNVAATKVLGVVN